MSVSGSASGGGLPRDEESVNGQTPIKHYLPETFLAGGIQSASDVLCRNVWKHNKWDMSRLFIHRRLHSQLLRNIDNLPLFSVLHFPCILLDFSRTFATVSSYYWITIPSTVHHTYLIGVGVWQSTVGLRISMANSRGSRNRLHCCKYQQKTSATNGWKSWYIQGKFIFCVTRNCQDVCKLYRYYNVTTCLPWT